jgi:drug/metabolite transporter (DMT)-like permease
LANLWPVVLCGVSSHFGYYFWDIGMKKGDMLLLGAASYLTPVLST